jgi:hypothetical protein
MGSVSPEKSGSIDTSTDRMEESALSRWRRLRLAFEHIDVAGAGTVSMSEMVSVMTREDLHMGDEEMLDLMRRYERFSSPSSPFTWQVCNAATLHVLRLRILAAAVA